MRLGFPFSVSLSPLLSLSLTYTHVVCRYLSPSLQREDPSLLSLSPTCSFHLSLSRIYSASIDSGMDHLIHPICIPLMLPVDHGMSAPTHRPAGVQCRTYGIVYPRSRSFTLLNFYKSVYIPDAYLIYLIRARDVSSAMFLSSSMIGQDAG